MTDLITLEEAKSWLGIKLGDTASDEIVTGLISAVTEAIQTWCEVSWALVVKTNEVHDARRQDILVPKEWPVNSIQAVRIGVNSDGTGGVTMDPTSYYADDVEIRLLTTQMPLQRGYVAIDYTYGFNGIPARVKLAAKIAVEGFFRARARQTVGITSKSKEGESINFKGAWNQEAGLPAESVALLKSFRMIEFPIGSAVATRNS